MSDRRRVLKVLGAASAMGAAGVTALPVLGLVAAPANTRPPTPSGARGASTDGWYTLARFEDLEVAKPVLAAVQGPEIDAWTVAPDRRLGAVWILRTGEGTGTVKAFSAECPHVGCQIEAGEGRFRCPCHESDFALDGRCLTGPSPRGMDPLEVRVEAGAVRVLFTRYRLGVVAREQQS